ncbi:MAG: Fic family protein [Bacteroidales bacterium]|nr:Fic family protein [Bacteroidales bacterium]
MSTLKIIPTEHLTDFKTKINFKLRIAFEKIEYGEFSKDIFYFNTNSVASSAKIEGEIASSEDLIQYLKHKKKFKPSYINATNDLYNAYIFAQNNNLTKKNLLKAHKLLTKNLLLKSAQGKIRIHDELIYNEDGNILYTAAQKEDVKQEFDKLMHDLDLLLKRELDIKNIFYFGFMLSLVFVKIHPFEDGNGRASRLLEKWFIAEKLGKKAWFLKSELNYYNKRKSYFLTLNKMGLFYEETNYSNAISISTYTANTLKNL